MSCFWCPTFFLNYDHLNGNFKILKWRYVNVPYFWPYFVGRFPYISRKNMPFFYGRYLHFFSVLGQHGHWSSPLTQLWFSGLKHVETTKEVWWGLQMKPIDSRLQIVCRWMMTQQHGSRKPNSRVVWSNVARWHASGERHIRFIPIRFCLASVVIFWSECGALPSVSWGHAARWWVLNILSI